MIFVPAFIVAVVMLGNAVRALVLAATFTAGAAAGFLPGLLLGALLLDYHPQETSSAIYLYVFASAGAVGGGVLAVWLLGKFSKYPPWRRY